MSLPRISVPLTQDGQRMELEWYRALQTIESGGTTPGDNTGGISITDFNALQAQILALANTVGEYEARIAALERGYQA